MTTQKIKVALLAGGRSGEREVSLSGAAQVSKALNPERYQVFNYDPVNDLERLIKEGPDLDVALIILHGRWGEDGTLQGLLDQIGLPYQGSGVLSSAICMDKRAAKNLYRQSGLLVARDLVLDRKAPLPDDRIMESMGLPLVVKPACEGSSLGAAIVNTAEDLTAGLEKAFKLDRWVIVEEYLKGRELTVGVLGNDELEVLPVIEIIPGQEYEYFDYEAKYKPGASMEICPAQVPDIITRRAQDIGLIAHRALFCRGYSRTDMILKDDRIYVLETNTIPGMTATSLFPQAAQAAGYSYSALMDRLIDLAMEKD